MGLQIPAKDDVMKNITGKMSATVIITVNKIRTVVKITASSVEQVKHSQIKRD